MICYIYLIIVKVISVVIDQERSDFSLYFWVPLISMFIYLFIYLFDLMHTYHLQNSSNIRYYVAMYARDVATGDQHPIRLTSMQLNMVLYCSEVCYIK